MERERPRPYRPRWHPFYLKPAPVQGRVFYEVTGSRDHHRRIGYWSRPIGHERLEEIPSEELTGLREDYKRLWSLPVEQRCEMEIQLPETHRRLLLDSMDSVSLPSAPQDTYRVYLDRIEKCPICVDEFLQDDQFYEESVSYTHLTLPTKRIV